MVITLYFPSRDLGGSELLFIRYALGLIEAGHEVWFVDFEDGTSARLLNEREIAFRHICCNENREVKIPAGSDLLIINSYDFYSLHKIKVDYDVRFLICEVHASYWYFRKEKNIFATYLKRFLMKSLCQDIINHKGFIILEKKSLDIMKDLGLENVDGLSLVLLPVDGFSGNEKKSFRPERFSVASIGRPVPEKIVPVIWAFSKIAEMDLDVNLVFITNSIEDAQAVWLKFEKDLIKKVTFVDGLHGKKLDDYLNENVDLFIGMATTTLEAGKLGVPALILDKGGVPYPDAAKVRFLYQAGDNLSAMTPDTKDGLSIEDAVLYVRENYAEASSKTRQYVYDNHHVNSVAKQLLRCIEGCTLDFNSLRYSNAYRMRLLLINASLLRDRLRRMTGKV